MGTVNFFLRDTQFISILFRKVFLNGIIIYILFLPIISLIVPIKKLYFGYNFKIKDVVFLWVTAIFNSSIIINIIFKDFWGRARPGDILQLGGKEFFTPWHEISSACDSNCSFVSGDASVGFALVVLYFLTKNQIYFWLSLIFGTLLGVVRVMEGAHFVSDVIMASTIMFFIYFLQTNIYLKKYA